MGKNIVSVSVVVMEAPMVDDKKIERRRGI